MAVFGESIKRAEPQAMMTAVTTTLRAFVKRRGNLLGLLGMIGVVVALIVVGQMMQEQRRQRCYALLDQERRNRGDVVPLDDRGYVYGYALGAMPENTCADGQMPPEYRYLQNQLDT